MDRPNDGNALRMSGVWVKIGRNNRVFNWINGQWLLSTKSADDVTGFVKRQAMLARNAQAARQRKRRLMREAG